MGNTTREQYIAIESYATVRTRTYRRQISIDVSALDPAGWMKSLILAIERRAEIRPEPTADLALFRDALALILSKSECAALLNLEARQVGRVQMRRLFGFFENLLLSSSWRVSVKHRAGTYFRKYVLEFADQISFAEDITRKTLRFRTQMYISSLPRSVISDIPLSEGSDRMPLSATPHNTLGELYGNALNRIDVDLQRVMQACIDELKTWAAARHALEVASRLPFEREEIELCRAVRHTGSKRDLLQFSRLSAQRQLGLYGLAITTEKLASSDGTGGDFPGVLTLLADELKLGKSELAGILPRQVLFLPHRIHSMELVAIFTLLLCYTGWNSHALVNLTADRIRPVDSDTRTLHGPLALQGFKSKTDDDTPVVVLDSTHPYAVYAANLLLWNNHQLKTLGVISKSEMRLWFSYSNVFRGVRSQQYIGFQNALSALIERHKLPKFSFDQIRPQKLLGEQLRTNNIDHVRDIAGHFSIGTTNRYHDQELFRRLNSAINLEFQRRLEATVQYRLSECDVATVWNFDKGRVDQALLIPIGDGASCAAPGEPPFMSYLEGDLCNAKACHAGHGCSNRRIVINEARIEELVRRRRYYIENWTRLLDANREAFEKFHSGRLLFALGLYDIIKNGPYAGVLRAIEKKVEIQ